MSPSPSAAALQQLGTERDPEAWAYLVEHHCDAMYQTCLAVLRDHHLAEDALHEAFLCIRDGARHFKANGQHAEAMAKAWLRRVATTSALQIGRRRSSQQRREQIVAKQNWDTTEVHEDGLKTRISWISSARNWPSCLKTSATNAVLLVV